jgi:hypothetical protein
MNNVLSFAIKAVASTVCLSVLCAGAALGAGTPPKPIRQEGNGRLYNQGGLPVAVLSGTFHDMGRQYGALLAKEIRGTYDFAIRDCFIKSGQFQQAELDALADGLYKTLPMRQKELLRGIAETVHMTRQEATLTANIAAVQIVARKKYGGTISSCTSGAAWGKYTADGKVITARDFDYPDSFRRLARDYRVMVVYKPTDGSNAVAGLTIAGGISLLDAMNSKGLYIEQNNGADSGGMILFANRTDASTQVNNVLFDASDSDEFRHLMESTRFNYPLIIMQADATAARFYETCTWDLQVREAQGDPIIAVANQFLHPAWGMLSLPSPAAWYSSYRWETLVKLMKQAPGSVVDEKSLMGALDIPFYNEDGSVGKGVAVLKKNPKDDEVTVWQVITRPSERKMWVRFPTLTGWIPLDLNEWFK